MGCGLRGSRCFVGVVVAASLNQAAFTSQTITGAVIYALTAGSIYAIAASGLVVTYTTSGVFNFAQGAIGMLMAFLYWEVRINHGWPAWIAIVFVVLIVAPLFGAVVDWSLMRRLVATPLVVQLVVTIGLMFFLMGLAATIWDENSHLAASPEFLADKHGIDIGDVVLTWHRFITIIVAVLVAIFLRFLLYRSRTGVAMRAVVDNRELAGLQRRPAGPASRSLAWALGSSMAAIAGILLAPNVGLRVDVLTLFIVDAFAAAIIGRLRSLPWTFVGGLIIGVDAELRPQLPAVGWTVEHRVDRDPGGDPVRGAARAARGAPRDRSPGPEAPRAAASRPQTFGGRHGRARPRRRADRGVRRHSTPPTCGGSPSP